MKPKLIVIGIGLAAWYFAGTETGRAQLGAFKAKVTELWEDPRVTRARKDVESYAREQAPVIRERAEAAAKAAPGVIADVAKDVAHKSADLAKDVADRSTDIAKDVADRVANTAKDVAGKATTTAKDVAGKVTDTAGDVRDSANKVASDLRERGEALLDTAVSSAGEARDKALDVIDDEDDDESPAKA